VGILVEKVELEAVAVGEVVALKRVVAQAVMASQ
jgi:hypothetical protein